MRCLIFVFASAVCAAQTPAESIRKVLDEQVASWNRGDIDAFMGGYNKSADTKFIGQTLQQGWESVRQRYHERYPTTEKMGKLDFADLEITVLSAEYANVVGRFHLTRGQQAGGEAKGYFTLLFRKTEHGWKIVQDHTS